MGQKCAAERPLGTPRGRDLTACVLEDRGIKSTHAKILIPDQTWISASFDWLSFRETPTVPTEWRKGHS